MKIPNTKQYQSLWVTEARKWTLRATVFLVNPKAGKYDGTVSVLGFADVDSVDSVDTARTTSVL
jgi:hypothetical protein